MKHPLQDEDVRSLAEGLEFEPSEVEALSQVLREILIRSMGLSEGEAPRPVVNEDNAREIIDGFLGSVPPYPEGRFRGRGVVMCAGGSRMFRCAWVCLNFLRRFGCSLPVEMWALQDSELTDRMKALAAPLGVEFVDAARVRRQYPARILNAWELKPFALLHSRFEELILLDADNVPLIDPELLLSHPEYERTGSIFWPDAERFAPDDPIWRICGLAYRDEPQFESGQIVLDKRRSWRALQLTKHLNDHSDFYYRYVHGDKDTFHLAWRILDQEFAMTPFAMTPLFGAMCQHDFDGRRIFQHRNFLKWDRESGSISGFLHEKDCWRLLAALDQDLDGD